MRAVFAHRRGGAADVAGGHDLAPQEGPENGRAHRDRGLQLLLGSLAFLGLHARSGTCPLRLQRRELRCELLAQFFRLRVALLADAERETCAEIPLGFAGIRGLLQCIADLQLELAILVQLRGQCLAPRRVVGGALRGGGQVVEAGIRHGFVRGDGGELLGFAPQRVPAIVGERRGQAQRLPLVDGGRLVDVMQLREPDDAWAIGDAIGRAFHGQEGFFHVAGSAGRDAGADLKVEFEAVVAPSAARMAGASLFSVEFAAGVPPLGGSEAVVVGPPRVACLYGDIRREISAGVSGPRRYDSAQRLFSSTGASSLTLRIREHALRQRAEQPCEFIA